MGVTESDGKFTPGALAESLRRHVAAFREEQKSVEAEIARLHQRRYDLEAEVERAMRALKAYEGTEPTPPPEPPPEPPEREEKPAGKPTAKPLPQRTSPEAVRDAARELGTFTLRELVQKLGFEVTGANRGRVKRVVEKWEAQGVIASKGMVGKSPEGGRPPEVYHYVKPAEAGVTGPRSREEHRKANGGVPDPGPLPTERKPTGRPAPRGARTNSGEVNKLLVYAEKHGAKCSMGGSGHIKVEFPGGAHVRVSSTPDTSAIGLIHKDLNHAIAGRRRLISQGG